MAINWGAGLAEAGKTLGGFFQQYALEDQKGELDKQRLQIANQYAADRETQRQTFESGEKEKDRGARKEEHGAELSLRKEEIGLNRERVGIERGRLAEEQARHTTEKEQGQQRIDLTEKGQNEIVYNAKGGAYFVDKSGNSKPLLDPEGVQITRTDSDFTKQRSLMMVAKKDQLDNAVKEFTSVYNNLTRQYDAISKDMGDPEQASKLKVIDDQRRSLVNGHNTTKGQLAKELDAIASWDQGTKLELPKSGGGALGRLADVGQNYFKKPAQAPNAQAPKPPIPPTGAMDTGLPPNDSGI